MTPTVTRLLPLKSLLPPARTNKQNGSSNLNQLYIPPVPPASAKLFTLGRFPYIPAKSICTGLHFTIGRIRRICSWIPNRFVPLRPCQPFVQTVQINQLSNNRLLKFTFKSLIVNLWNGLHIMRLETLIYIFTGKDSVCLHTCKETKSKTLWELWMLSSLSMGHYDCWDCWSQLSEM